MAEDFDLSEYDEGFDFGFTTVDADEFNRQHQVEEDISREVAREVSSSVSSSIS